MSRHSAEKCEPHHLCPAQITQPRCLFGGANDIDKEDRGERLLELGAAIGGPAPGGDISGQRFIAMVAPPRDRGFRIIVGTLHRAATNGLVPRWKRPVNLSRIRDAQNLDCAPLQENHRAGPSNAPRLRGVPGDVRLMDSDAKEF
jgi:hypothetical protein